MHVCHLQIQFEDDLQRSCDEEQIAKKQKMSVQFPVNLELDHVLGKMPQKVLRIWKDPIFMG